LRRSRHDAWRMEQDSFAWSWPNHNLKSCLAYGCIRRAALSI
jgi:hypothetical protein